MKSLTGIDRHVPVSPSSLAFSVVLGALVVVGGASETSC